MFKMFYLNLTHVYISFIFILLYINSTNGDEQCSFRNGECTYNIQLSRYDGNCGPSSPHAPQAIKSVESNEIEKMFQMEQDFTVVKDDHEARIRELEHSIQKVLRAAISSAPAKITLRTTDDDHVGAKGQTDTIISGTSATQDNGLIMQLQREFNRIRTALKTKTADLIRTSNKLNESADNLKETQKALFRTSEQLVNAETKLAVLENEGYILKNKVKDKTERLEIVEDKLNISESKRKTMEIQLFDLVRSESNLREELQYFKIMLNRTQKALEDLQRNHTALHSKHAKTKQTLRTRELELMECYMAKTNTFCGFEDENNCGFTQDNETDVFDWQRVRGRTPSSNTGPTHDKTCESSAGHFMYIEASAKSKGNNAIMYSPKYRGLSQQCVQFYYHMYGRNVGTLTVYTKLVSSDELESVWRVFGNQGNVWILARLSIPEEISRAGYQIVFEGIAEDGYEGDISIDNVSVYDGECPTDYIGAVEVTAPQNMTKTSVLLQLQKYRAMLRKRHRQRFRKTDPADPP